jgi:DNA-binding response OmpR family regulator
VVAVAITRLAKHGGSISPFVRYVKNYFAFYSLYKSARKILLHPAKRTGDVWDPRADTVGQGGGMAGYTRRAQGSMALARIGILIVDNDEASQSALRQVLDSEGWHVRVVPLVSDALAELSSGEWSLVIVNIAMTGLAGPVYLTLKELALSPAVEEGNVRARVLFLVPESAGSEVRVALEKVRLPYVLKPFQFNDFLEKVSDLLMETDALTTPIRRVRHDASAAERKRKETRAGHESAVRQGRRDTGMFAKRDDYVMTEEEIAEYEKAEKEEQEQRKKKKQPQGR